MNTKKFLALILVLALVVCTLPVVFAAKDEPAGDSDDDISIDASHFPAEDEEADTSGTEGALDWELNTEGELSFSGEGAMADGSGLTFDREAVTSVVIGDGATSIAAGAFSGCANLESVTIGKDVAEIGANAFKDCTSLTELKLKKATTIGANAFSGCTGLTKIRMACVTAIGENAFTGCSADLTVYCRLDYATAGSFAEIFTDVDFLYIGDLDQNKVINPTDASLLRVYLAGLGLEPDPDIANVYGDNVINPTDAAILRAYFAGMPVSFE